MPWKMNVLPRNALTNRSFLLFFLSQVSSGLGDTFQLIAATSLLVKITGSGLAAGFGMICAPMPSIILSLFAGSLGDRLNEKFVLMTLDVLRAFVAIFFVFAHDILAVYILLLLLSSLDALYYPSRNKMLTGTLESKNLMVGNSVLSGGYGFVYLIGPTLAGIIVGVFDVDVAFYINGLSFILSALLISNIQVRNHKGNTYTGRLRKQRSLIKDTREGIEYCRNIPALRSILLTAAVISLGTISVNVAFYPFAFDTLGVSSKGWGIMLSVLYGTSLLAMLISMGISKKGLRHPLFVVTLLLLGVSFIWLSYGVIDSLTEVLLLQIMEGTLLALCNIFINTQIQLSANKGFLARVMGINDIVCNSGKLLGAGCTYMVLRFFSTRYVFMMSAFILFTFCVLRLLRMKKVPGKP